jgi:hypothetical protein
MKVLIVLLVGAVAGVNAGDVAWFAGGSEKPVEDATLANWLGEDAPAEQIDSDIGNNDDERMEDFVADGIDRSFDGERIESGDTLPCANPPCPAPLLAANEVGEGMDVDAYVDQPTGDDVLFDATTGKVTLGATQDEDPYYDYDDDQGVQIEVSDVTGETTQEDAVARAKDMAKLYYDYDDDTVAGTSRASAQEDQADQANVPAAMPEVAPEEAEEGVDQEGEDPMSAEALDPAMLEAVAGAVPDADAETIAVAIATAKALTASQEAAPDGAEAEFGVHEGAAVEVEGAAVAVEGAAVVGGSSSIDGSGVEDQSEAAATNFPGSIAEEEEGEEGEGEEVPLPCANPPCAAPLLASNDVGEGMSIEVLRIILLLSLPTITSHLLTITSYPLTIYLTSPRQQLTSPPSSSSHHLHHPFPPSSSSRHLHHPSPPQALSPAIASPVAAPMQDEHEEHCVRHCTTNMLGVALTACSGLFVLILLCGTSNFIVRCMRDRGVRAEGGREQQRTTERTTESRRERAVDSREQARTVESGREQERVGELGQALRPMQY